MPFFRKSVSSRLPASPDELHLTEEESIQRNVKQIIHSLQKDHPGDFEQVLREIERGESGHARRTLRGLGSVVEDAYREPVLREIQALAVSARLSSQEALEENPHALRILLRSGNRSEAIALYQKRTGVDWQAALDAIKDLEQKLAQENGQ